MPAHKFHVGQIVHHDPAVSRNVPGGAYVITKQLPANSTGEYEYCIKGMNEPHQRVARENELNDT